jgi:hypothetical protein
MANTYKCKECGKEVLCFVSTVDGKTTYLRRCEHKDAAIVADMGKVALKGDSKAGV